MAFRTYLLSAALVASLAVAPAAHADHWRGGWGYGDGGSHHHHHNNNAAAAIIGGLVGLGVGAAIASGNGYYGAPGYYAPPPAYYPVVPAVYPAYSPYYYAAPVVGFGLGYWVGSAWHGGHYYGGHGHWH